jgi:hypothetical protein
MLKKIVDDIADAIVPKNLTTFELALLALPFIMLAVIVAALAVLVFLHNWLGRP